MSSTGGGGGGGIGGITYQSIIIALVAGGILTIGVMSILWRRRTNRRWADLGLRFPEQGRTGVGAERKKGKRLGRVPKVWDVLVGPREREGGVEQEEEENEGGLRGGEEHDGAEGEAAEKRRVENEMRALQGKGVDMDGGMEEGWYPTSFALVHDPSPSAYDSRTSLLSEEDELSDTKLGYAAEVTVLIAMPSPHRCAPIGGASASSPPASPGQPRLPDSLLYTHPSLPTHIEPEDEPLPPLEIGSTITPISFDPSLPTRRPRLIPTSNPSYRPITLPIMSYAPPASPPPPPPPGTASPADATASRAGTRPPLDPHRRHSHAHSLGGPRHPSMTLDRWLDEAERARVGPGWREARASMIGGGTGTGTGEGAAGAAAIAAIGDEAEERVRQQSARRPIPRGNAIGGGAGAGDAGTMAFLRMSGVAGMAGARVR